MNETMKRKIAITLFLLLLAACFLSCGKEKREKQEDYVYPTETYDTPPDTVIDRFDGKNNGLVLNGNVLYYAADAGLFRFD